MSEDKKQSERGLRPGQKSRNFGPSLKRLLRELMVEKTM